MNFAGVGLRAEIQNVSGVAIEPFTLQNCVAFNGDSTRVGMQWKGQSATGLAALVGKAVQILFEYGGEEISSLYSFWLATKCGESMGYAAGGGPGITGEIDTKGGCRTPPLV